MKALYQVFIWVAAVFIVPFFILGAIGVIFDIIEFIADIFI